MTLFTSQQRETLLANGRRQAPVRGTPEEIDFFPVVKLFTPDARCIWLLTELDPQDTDIAFGLCDLGMGFPELGPVSVSELAALHGTAGLAVECDRFFEARHRLSAYANAARKAGRIVDLPSAAEDHVADITLMDEAQGGHAPPLPRNWRDHLDDLTEALALALLALNCAPRFPVHKTDSYAIAARISRVLADLRAGATPPKPREGETP